MRDAFVTIVDGDKYAIGAVVLSKSFRATNSLPKETDLLILVPFGGFLSSTAEGFLKSEGGYTNIIRLQTGIEIEMNEMRPDQNRAGATRINLFNLTDYNRVLYVDADTFAVSRFPIFFKKKYWKGNISGVTEVSSSKKELKGSMLAIRPNREIYERLHVLLQGPVDYPNGDQGFLHKAFKSEYNQLKMKNRIPQTWHLTAVQCWLADKQTGFRKKYFKTVKKAKLFDWQGQSKPWKWAGISPSFEICHQVLPQWLTAWMVIAYSPTIEYVREFLEIFNKDRESLEISRQYERVLSLAKKAYDAREVNRSYYQILSSITSSVMNIPFFTPDAQDEIDKEDL